MKVFAQALDLKDDPEIIEKYKEYHRNVWPDVLQSIRELGIERMRIWLVGRRMFMLMETRDDYDPASLMEYAEKNPKAGEWNELMMTYQEKVPGAGPDEWWASMELVFDSEG